MALTPRLTLPNLNTTEGPGEEGPISEDGLLIDDTSDADFLLIDDNGIDYLMIED